MTTGTAYPEAGAILGRRYVLLHEIGRGGHSVVYAARDTTLGVEVAVKLLAPSPATAAQARGRLRREVELVRMLRHPHIVGVHDVVEDGGNAFVIMDLVSGSDLAKQLQRSGPLDIDIAMRIGRELAEALGAAHRVGILHRDVKPENVLLDGHQRALLADFGSARLEGTTTVTVTGELAGTLLYAAPEILAGQRGDGRSDLFSLGMTLYEALTGALPEHQRHLPPVPAARGHHPRVVRSEIPEWLDALVARATAANPCDRFPTVDAFRAAFDRATGSVPEPADEGEPLEGPGGCLVCAAPTLPGSPLCLACDPVPARPVGYVFVRDAGPRFDKVLATLLANHTDIRARHPVRESALGKRALIRVPLHSGQGICEWLADRSVRVELRSQARVWGRIPLALYAMVLLCVSGGVAAGLIADPVFLYASPLLAPLLLYGAYREVSRPALEISRRERPGHRITATAADQLRELGPGPARDLLVSVLRLARHLADGEPAGASSLTLDLEALTVAAADAALELDRLDGELEGANREAATSRRLPPNWWSSVAETEQARDRVAQSLLELAQALGSARRLQAADPTAPRAMLGALTQELGDGTHRRADALAEVATIVAAW